MTKRKLWIITAITLAVYTAAVILCFAFIRGRDTNTDTNNAWTRSYTFVDYTDEEKAEIYQGIGLDINKLTARGFALYREDFLTPFSYPKELHVIELGFEDIYCNVSIYVHADEIKWYLYDGTQPLHGRQILTCYRRNGRTHRRLHSYNKYCPKSRKAYNSFVALKYSFFILLLND